MLPEPIESPAGLGGSRTARTLIGAMVVLVALVALVVALGLITRAMIGGADGTPTAATVPLDASLRVTAPGSASWAPWPQAQHDAQRSGSAPVQGPATDHVRWHRDLGANVTPGPVVGADGTIYAATNAGVLTALDPDSGSTVWTLDTGHPYGLDLSTSPAILRDGTILWPGPDAALIAVSPDGEQLWTLPFEGQPTSPALSESGVVVVGDSAGNVVELKPTRSGPDVQWRWSGQESSYGSAVLSADGATAYQSLTSGVAAIRQGKLIWRWQVPSKIVEVSPAVTPRGDVVIGTNDPYQYCLDGETGEVLWRYRRGFWTYSSPAVTRDGIAYFGDHSNTIAGLDSRTGSLRFRFTGDQTDDGPGGIGIWTSIVVDSAHTVFAGTRQGLVYAVDASGTRLWQRDLGATIDSYPALTADGVLVVGSTDGRLYAIGPD